MTVLNRLRKSNFKKHACGALVVMAMAANTMLDAVLGGPSFLFLSRSQGKTVGTNTSYSSAEILTFPLAFEPVLPFFDVQSHYFDRGRGCAGNVGGGVRFVPDPSGFIFGANAFYDFRQVNSTILNQLGLGFELLGDRWNFRLNGYLPIGQKTVHVSDCFYDGYAGGYFYLQRNYVTAHGGADFEAEVWLKRGAWAGIRGGLGGYYFGGKRCNTRAFGLSYRISADIIDYITIDALGSYDRVYGPKFQGTLRIAIPLGGTDPRVDRVYQRIRRNDIVVLKGHHCAIFNWNDER